MLSSKIRHNIKFQDNIYFVHYYTYKRLNLDSAGQTKIKHRPHVSGYFPCTANYCLQRSLKLKQSTARQEPLCFSRQPEYTAISSWYQVVRSPAPPVCMAKGKKALFVNCQVAAQSAEGCEVAASSRPSGIRRPQPARSHPTAPSNTSWRGTRLSLHKEPGTVSAYVTVGGPGGLTVDIPACEDNPIMNVFRLELLFFHQWTHFVWTQLEGFDKQMQNNICQTAICGRL